MAKASTVKATTAKVEEFAAEAQKNINEGVEKMTKGFGDMTTFGQDNVEALNKTAEIATKAVEGIGSEISAFSKKSFDETVAAAQDFAAAKTVTELFEKQTAFAQTAFEAFVQQATKMNDIYVAAAKEISAPISARVTAATESVKTFTV